jgi:carbon storage regulator CsrA
MLILARNQNESIVIDNDIRITVLSDRRGQVRLGIEASQDVEIWSTARRDATLSKSARSVMPNF